MARIYVSTMSAGPWGALQRKTCGEKNDMKKKKKKKKIGVASKEDKFPAKLVQLGLGFWASKAFLSAVEFGVFSELAKEPTDAQTLGERLGIHPRGARDFLDALVALG